MGLMKEDRIYLEGLLKDASELYDYPANMVKNIWGNIVREGQEKYEEGGEYYEYGKSLEELERAKERYGFRKSDYDKIRSDKELTMKQKRDLLRMETQAPTNATTSDINVDVKNAIDNNKVNQDYQKGLLSDKANRMNYLFPGTLDISNKDLINAAILRGSLELLKPRQQGENFASQASRALEAGLKTQLDVGALKIADAKGRTTGTNRISELRFLDESRNDLYSMMSTVGISKDGKFLFEEGGSFNNAFQSLIHDVYRRSGFDAADRFQLDVANQFKSLVKKSDDKGDKLTFNKTGDKTMDAALSFLVNSYNNARAEDNKPKNEGKKEEPSMIDKSLETIGF
tara:strand:+ start:1267 stop:2295 length:1029 start_codon:yes stop_codon:yes gene_type:complete